jgi:hypothetical protein
LHPVWLNNSDGNFIRLDISSSSIITISLVYDNKHNIGAISLPLCFLDSSAPSITLERKFDFSANAANTQDAVSKKVNAELEALIRDDCELPKLKITFQSEKIFGSFFITKIICKNLKNVELINLFGKKNDPYVKFAFGSWKCQTSAIPDGGSDVQWEREPLIKKFKMYTAVSESMLRNEKLLVEVYDENKARSDVLIGRSYYTFEHIDQFARSSIMEPITMVLKDNNDKEAGKITLFIELANS